MDPHPDDEGKSLLDKLDSIPAVRAFDAFPKTQPLYTSRSHRGGIFTLFVALVLLWLTWAEFAAYLTGHPSATFGVDHELGKEMQVNVDITVAMKCEYLTVDVRDAAGDRLHFSDTDITKDETDFEIGHAGRLDSIPLADLPIGDMISAAKHFHRPTFSRKAKPKRKAKGYSNRQVAFAPTEHIVENGNACRIYGSVLLKKVTGNLHISTLGHGYFSFVHTPHNIMNLSHVIHELSFGPYFPDISQPLDHVVEISNEHFAIFQYFVNIVPTKYIDAWSRSIDTNQYSVTDYSRTVQHGQGVPGVFFKFDFADLQLTMKQRTTSFSQFLIRLAGIIGGVWVCAGYGLRAGDKAAKTAMKMYKGGNDDDDGYGYPENLTAGYTSTRQRHSRTGSFLNRSSHMSTAASASPMANHHASPFHGQTYATSPLSPHSSSQPPPPPYDTSMSMSMSMSMPPHQQQQQQQQPWSGNPYHLPHTGGDDQGDTSSTSLLDSSFASLSGAMGAARERAGQVWQTATGSGSGSGSGSASYQQHSKTDSVQQRLLSEEGRGW